MNLPALRPSAPRTRSLVGALALVALAVAATAASLGAPRAARADGPARPATAPAPTPPAWPDEVLAVAAHIPMQEGGRVKPLDTFAGYTLMGIAHRRSCKDPDGRALAPIEWLLDVLVRTDRARRYECFQIENDEVLDGVGLPHEGKKKRDLYSYEALAPARARIRAQAEAYAAREAKDRTPVEGETVDLHHALAAFERVASMLDFARADLDVSAPALQPLFGGRPSASLLDVLGKAGELVRMAGVDDPHGGGAAAPAGTDADRAAATALLEKVADLAASARGLALVPPPVAASEQPEWYAIGDVLVAMQQGIPMDPEIAGFVTHLAAMQRTAHDPAAFLPEIRAFQATAERLARARGEYQKVDLEVTLNRLDPFHRAGHLYLLAFLAVAVGWMVRNPWPRRVAWGLVLATLALHVTGIVIRCILRERPPISTLYETVLFISAVVVTLCLVIEAIDRHAIALSVAPVLGAAGMYLAGSYEALKGEDTMPQLIAVLDTNFWLATHVTCIAIGYCGGLLAAFFALVGVVGRLVRRGSDDFYRVVHRFTYGILCFGLIFSVVGTILGGIWANDSWGRFWGWDPKENGALMICLAQLAILHGRLGGYLKPHGFAVATLAHGAVVAFSWWHVNYLGIGLHSYGFTKGVITTLWTVYGIVGAIVLAGIVDIAVRAGGGRSRAVP